MKHITNIILALVILSVYISSGYAQKVSTNIYANPHVCDTMESFCFYPFCIVDIEQELIIENFQQDTFVLELEHAYVMQQILYPYFYQNMSIKYKQGTEIVSLPHEFYNTTLSFVLPSPSCTLRLYYQYSTDYLSRTAYAPCYFFPCIFGWNSWYFTCQDMKITHAEITDYDSAYMIVNLPYIKKGNKTILDVSSIDYNEGITFHLFEKSYHQEVSFKEGKNTVHLLMSRGEIRVPKVGEENQYYSYPGKRISEELINKYINAVKDAIKKLNDFIYPLENSELTIVESDLTMKTDYGNIQWGVSLPVWKDNKFSILIDTSVILQSHTLIHEMIHIYYNNILPPDSDSTSLFFGESMTEYLAKCLKYDDLRQRDSVFNQKMIEFANGDNGVYSIFKVSDNNMGDGSSHVIYSRTPFVIHVFAQMMGEEKFLAVLSRFYKEAKQRKEISFNHFEQLMKENGVSDKQWDWFVKNL
jgi:hypothetical protein